jgi:hypothetical protein
MLRERSRWASGIKEDIIRPVRGRRDHCDVKYFFAPSYVTGLLGVHLRVLLLDPNYSMSLPTGARGRGVQRYKLLGVLTCLPR